MLDVAGAPKVESDFIGDVRLMTGTMWHKIIEESLGAVPELEVRTERKLDQWLHEGWSGTADWIFWHPALASWILGDLKTIKGEGVKWVEKDGMKNEHMWQLSAYWWALEAAGQPLWPDFGVLYLPMNNVPREDVHPTLQWGKPLPKGLVWGRMAERWDAMALYKRTLGLDDTPGVVDLLVTADDAANIRQRWPDKPITMRIIKDYSEYLTDALAPVQDRIQKVLWDGKKEIWNLLLVPHWSTDYCPFPTELCDCRDQGSTKVGHYTLDGNYVPRKGYEAEIPLAAPDEWDFRKRRQENRDKNENKEKAA